MNSLNRTIKLLVIAAGCGLALAGGFAFASGVGSLLINADASAAMFSSYCIRVVIGLGLIAAGVALSSATDE